MIQRILIADDEPPARAKMVRFVKRVAPEAAIFEAADGLEAARLIIAERPGLAFLDIEMPEMTGLEVVKSLGEDGLPAVIFATAFDQYAITAFEHAAIDYLLKPFTYERFEKAYRRALARSPASGLYAETIIQLADTLQRGRGTLQRLLVRQNDRIIPVELDDVTYFAADDKYVAVHTRDRSLLLRESLHHLEAQLDPKKFVRTHRSYIVHLDQVREYCSASHGDYIVKLKSGAEVPLSRRFAGKLLRPDAGGGVSPG